MPGHRYVEELDSAAMLATKRLAGVTPEVNLGEHVTHTTPPSVTRLPTLAFNLDETSPEVQNRGISDPTKRTYVAKT